MILIVTNEKYPEGDAGAVRVHSFAKLFHSAGYDVTVWGIGSTTNFEEKEFDKIKYRSLRYPSGSFFYRTLGRLLFKRNVTKQLKNVSMLSIEGIMLYMCAGNSMIKYLKKITHKYNIPLIYNCVEWFTPNEFKRGRLNSAYKQNNQQNSELIAKGEHTISISSYFHEYFTSKGIHSVRIPVVLDIQALEPKAVERSDGAMRIAYVGAPACKDKLCEMIRAFEMLNGEQLKRIRLDIVGITYDQYKNIFGDIKKELVDKNIFFHGRVPRNEAIEYLKKADFAYLLRPSDERYAKAGFPTKVAESLSLGVPMICNISSDLALYLKNMQNSIIIENCSADACYDALLRVLKLSRDDLVKMSVNARQTAETYFDWRVYQNDFKKFMDETII